MANKKEDYDGLCPHWAKNDECDARCQRCGDMCAEHKDNVLDCYSCTGCPGFVDEDPEDIYARE